MASNLRLAPEGKKAIQQLLHSASKPQLANEQGEDDKQCEREAGDDGVLRAGLQE
ncbi:MAG: hypothetical protein ABI614_29405 [Planctomycetota bacterium]